jgi:hypothetical protein
LNYVLGFEVEHFFSFKEGEKSPDWLTLTKSIINPYIIEQMGSSSVDLSLELFRDFE